MKNFYLTFFPVIILTILLLVFFNHDIKQHFIETKQYTLQASKSKILGYQTPNFSLLGKIVGDEITFDPAMLNDHQAGSEYLNFFSLGAKHFPQLFEMHYMKGICELYLGKLERARQSLEESTRINPTFFWNYYNLGILYLKLQQPTLAKQMFYTALQLPLEPTLMALHDLQAFYRPLAFTKNPGQIIQTHLQQAQLQAKELLIISIKLSENPNPAIYQECQHLHPRFF